MELLSVPRVFISGVSSGVGKSLLCLGLTMELRKRGHSVSYAVSGLNLNQSIIQKRICGRNVISFDDKLLSGGQILTSTYMASVGSDILIIEGNAGLYDGVFDHGLFRGSDSEVASWTKTPVCLVVDARNMGASLGALARGFADVASGFSVNSLIANRVSPKQEERDRLRTVFADALIGLSAPALIGLIPEISNAPQMPVATVSQVRNQTTMSRQFLVDAGNLVADNVDIPELLRMAEQAEYIKLEDLEYRPFSRRCRIAVSDDSAFNLMFQDNLEYLRYFGAELVPFSPLADNSLPNRIGAVYLTGAYLEEYAAEISANSTLKKAIRDFVQSGGVLFAEGASVAYLCREFSTQDQSSHEGIGVIDASAEPGVPMTIYQEISTIEESIFGRAGLKAKGISTNEWQLRGLDRMLKTLRCTQAGVPAYLDGFSPGAQIIATTSFIHFGSNPELAQHLVESASVVQGI